ncbi:MAG: hypothetical protein KTR31_28245 [Myxococcales bacterium]|nr:hypothetical protein [Myxococcales bacterium]
MQRGQLHPVRATAVVIAASDEGRPVTDAPELYVEGGVASPLQPLRDGVWRTRVTSGESTVVLRVGETRKELAVQLPPATALKVPARVDGWTLQQTVPIRITGEDLPDPGSLQVVSSGARLVDIEVEEDALVLHLDPGRDPHPRVIPVGIRDRRRVELPAWSLLRLRARPRVDLEAEPGAKLTLALGGRRYGPFEADARGRFHPRLEQYPGESVARATVRDDLGNETVAEVPLLTPTEPVLDALVEGQFHKESPAPVLHLFAADAAGQPSSGAPTCRTPTADLPVVRVDRQRWWVPVPVSATPEDVRVECTLGATIQTSRVRVANGVAESVSLRVWPTDLRTDFPVAEVRVAVHDPRGEQLSPDGLSVHAARGEVALDLKGSVARGEYTGTEALEAGEDEVVATFVAGPGEGPVADLLLGWDRVPTAEGASDLRLHAKALDASRRPLGGIPVALRAEGGAVRWTTTGDDGWASSNVIFGARTGPVPVEARTAHRSVHGVLLPGEAAGPGPGRPDLSTAQRLTLNPGRVVGISVEADPPVLRAGPGSVAYLLIRLEDRAGQPIVDEEVEIEVSEGSVGPLQARTDGTLVAEFSPLPAERSREVEITARTDALRSTTRLTLQPRIVKLSLGPWVGAQTNFQAFAGPALGIDMDVRTRGRVFGDSMMFRIGVQGTTFTTTAETEVGPDARPRSTVIPATLAVLFRDDRGPWSVWLGAGGSAALHLSRLKFGDDVVSAGQQALVGPAFLGGGARRALGGEIFVTLRAHWFPTSNDVGLTGNLGGVSAGLGYRLVY